MRTTRKGTNAAIQRRLEQHAKLMEAFQMLGYDRAEASELALRDMTRPGQDETVVKVREYGIARDWR